MSQLAHWRRPDVAARRLLPLCPCASGHTDHQRPNPANARFGTADLDPRRRFTRLNPPWPLHLSIRNTFLQPGRPQYRIQNP
jgi:hypothetical protein